MTKSMATINRTEAQQPMICAGCAGTIPKGAHCYSDTVAGHMTCERCYNREPWTVDPSLIRATIHNSDSVAPLANAHSSDPYPLARIFLNAGPTRCCIEAWKWVRRFEGPNDPADGSYAGPGWHERIDDNDGQFSGRPRARRVDQDDLAAFVPRDVPEWVQRAAGAIYVQPADNCEGDVWINGNSELADAIQEALDAAYDDWQPTLPDTDDIVYELKARAFDDFMRVEVDYDTNSGMEYTLDLHAGRHLGQPVFAVEGCFELFDDAAAAATAARAMAIQIAEEALQKAQELDVKEATAHLREKVGLETDD